MYVLSEYRKCSKIAHSEGIQVIYLKLLDDHLIVGNRLSQYVYNKYNPICNFALSFNGDIGFCESWPEKYSINLWWMGAIFATGMT